MIANKFAVEGNRFWDVSEQRNWLGGFELYTVGKTASKGIFELRYMYIKQPTCTIIMKMHSNSF